MLVQTHTQALRPLTTAHLAQTMTLLGLTAAELKQKVEAAMASNPALELAEEFRCPICKRRLAGRIPCPVCTRPPALTSDQPIVFVAPYEDFRQSSRMGEDPLEVDSYDNTAMVEELPEFVLRQVATELSPAERPLAAHILTNLDDDGLLEVSILEIARYHHVLPSTVENVLRKIQHAEPLGVASPTSQAALLVQLEVLSETRIVPPQAEQAIQVGLNLLSRRQYTELADLLGITTSQAKEIAAFIRSNLNPFPARAHWGEASYSSGSVKNPGAYYNPDVIIGRLTENDDSPLVIEVALPLAGMVRINPLFRQAIQEAPPEKAEQWKSDLEQASLLVKCVQQRNHTMVRLMQRLAVLQRDYILQGEAYLRPITRAALAKELEVHESTVSRAVSAKAAQLPNGHIVPLATFFDPSLHLRTAVRQIIAGETQPLTDTQIAERLAELGHHIARRTVAKYRSMEGILPAHLRKPVRTLEFAAPG